MNLLTRQPTRTTLTIGGVRAVVDGRLLDDARVTVENGIIIEIASGTRLGADTVDGRGAFLLPGLIDTHTDGFERERQPRQTATLDTVFALRSFEARLAGAGITTAFHGVGFDDRADHFRSLEAAAELWQAITDRRRAGRAPVDHRVLYRLEARTIDGFEAMRACLDREDADGPRPLVSFEDHTPGQGQYRDVQRYVEAMSDDEIITATSREERVAQIVAAAESTRELAERNRERVGELTLAGTVTALAHDVEDAEGITHASDWGAAIAEFPLTVEAARRARELAMPVVSGGPNALRGLSHSGNVAARDLITAGLCTVLASDYLPTSLLASVWLLTRSHILSLPQAVQLVTSGPAAAVGLDDRGVIEVGRRADLILVVDDYPWPRVVAVHSAGCNDPAFTDLSAA